MALSGTDSRERMKSLCRPITRYKCAGKSFGRDPVRINSCYGHRGLPCKPQDRLILWVGYGRPLKRPEIFLDLARALASIQIPPDRRPRGRPGTLRRDAPTSACDSQRGDDWLCPARRRRITFRWCLDACQYVGGRGLPEYVHAGMGAQHANRFLFRPRRSTGRPIRFRALQATSKAWCRPCAALKETRHAFRVRERAKAFSKKTMVYIRSWMPTSGLSSRSVIGPQIRSMRCRS